MITRQTSSNVIEFTPGPEPASTDATTPDAAQLYLKEIGYSALLSADEEKHFGKLAREGDEAGRKRMIESNLRLVVKISRRYLNRGLEPVRFD